MLQAKNVIFSAVLLGFMLAASLSWANDSPALYIQKTTNQVNTATSNAVTAPVNSVTSAVTDNSTVKAVGSTVSGVQQTASGVTGAINNVKNIGNVLKDPKSLLTGVVAAAIRPAINQAANKTAAVNADPKATKMGSLYAQNRK